MTDQLDGEQAPSTEAGRRFVRENGTSHIRLILAIEREPRVLDRQRVEALRDALETIADGRLNVSDGWTTARRLQDFAQDALDASTAPEPRPAPLRIDLARAIEWADSNDGPIYIDWKPLLLDASNPYLALADAMLRWLADEAGAP